MLNVNNKMYLNKRFVVVDVEFNTMFEIALAHILSHAYSITDTHIDDIEFDDVLFISDRTLPDYLLLESNDFKEAGVTMQRSNFPKRVRTLNAYNFNELGDHLEPFSEGINLIVLGFINTIPEHIFDNIMSFFGRGVNYAIFGDPLIDAPEYNSYFMRYLTNASVSVRLDYDSYRASDKKKINNTLSKLRKDVSSLSEITASNYVSISCIDDVSINRIEEYLEQDNKKNTVIIPKRLYGTVSSKLYERKFGRSSLDFRPGDIYLTKFHWTFKQDGNMYVVPPLTRIEIAQIYNQLFVMEHRCFVCDLSVLYDDREPVYVKQAVLDFTDFLFNFDSGQHPENIEDFEEIMNNINVFGNNTIQDSSVLKIMFTPVIISDMAKYYSNTENTMSYIETIERDSYYTSDFSWYKHFCNTINQIDIVTSDEFIDVL